jgi:hypothetical protein
VKYLHDVIPSTYRMPERGLAYSFAVRPTATSSVSRLSDVVSEKPQKPHHYWAVGVLLNLDVVCGATAPRVRGSTPS